MTRLPKSKCRVAGTTSDGRICYYGKKDSGDPNAEDLTFWVTLGLPRVDSSNYVRLASLGFDEDLDRRDCGIKPGEIGAWMNRRVSEFLASVHSRELKRVQGHA